MKITGALLVMILLLQSFAFAQEAEPYVMYDLGDVKIICDRIYLATGPRGAVYAYENYGVADKDGNLIVEQIYEAIDKPAGGRAAFQKDSKIGFFDENWKIVIEPRYACNIHPSISYFSEGLAPVGKLTNDSRYIAWGYIDKNGNEVTDFIYDWAGAFENGKARVGIGEYVYYYNTRTKTGVIDKEGNLIEPFKFSYDDLLNGSDTVDVLLSENLVELNGRRYENSSLEYPFINYLGYSYFPLTYHGCRMLGIRCDWTREDGVMLADGGGVTADIIGENHMQSGIYDRATIYKGKVSVNGKVYEYGDTPYPLISYKDVVYMPVLWQTGMESLGIEYEFLRPDQVGGERGCMVFKTQ